MTSRRTAILFFSFSVSREAREKKWYGQDMNKNRLLAKALVNRTRHVLNQAGLPVYHIHEGLQKGETFDDRFNNAFAYVFEKGYDSVIAFGNDTPDLVKLPWLAIKTALNNEQPVIGPNKRGGIYLCGLTRSMWQQGLLKDIPWKTTEVFHTIIERSGNVFTLPVYHDLNNRVDIRRYFRESRQSAWLLPILHAGFMSPDQVFCHAPAGIQSVKSLRAPPEERNFVY